MWELYNVDEDFSEANNLAAQNPEKLKELQAVFLKEAERNHVLPIDDRRSERFNPAIAGRPDLLAGARRSPSIPAWSGMMENAFINVKGVHHTDHRRSGTEGRQDQWRDHRAGRLLRRLDALHEGRQAASRIQLVRAGAHEHRRRRRRSRPASTRSATSSFPTRPSPAPAANRSSASTARRSPKRRSPRPSRSCSPPTKARTWASTPRRTCRRTTSRTPTPSPGRSSK